MMNKNKRGPMLDPCIAPNLTAKIFRNMHFVNYMLCTGFLVRYNYKTINYNNENYLYHSLINQMF